MKRRFVAPPTPALEELMRADVENGVDPGFDPRPAPGPPEVSAPMVRPVPPPADWRQELEERARREAAEQEVELEPTASLQSYPAPRKPRGPKTPNLNAARRMQAEIREGRT